MGTQEIEAEELQAKEPLLRYIIRQLFNQRVLLGVIGLGMAWIAYRQVVNGGKQDTVIAKQDTAIHKAQVTQTFDSTYRKRNDARWASVDSNFKAILIELKKKK